MMISATKNNKAGMGSEECWANGLVGVGHKDVILGKVIRERLIVKVAFEQKDLKEERVRAMQPSGEGEPQERGQQGARPQSGSMLGACKEGGATGVGGDERGRAGTEGIRAETGGEVTKGLLNHFKNFDSYLG